MVIGSLVPSNTQTFVDIYERPIVGDPLHRINAAGSRTPRTRAGRVVPARRTRRRWSLAIWQCRVPSVPADEAERVVIDTAGQHGARRCRARGHRGGPCRAPEPAVGWRDHPRCLRARVVAPGAPHRSSKPEAPVDETRLRRARRPLDRFGDLRADPDVPGELRQEAVHELFSHIDVAGPEIVALHPQPNENAWLLGDAAMKDGSLQTQERVGMVGVRGVKPPRPTLTSRPDCRWRSRLRGRSDGCAADVPKLKLGRDQRSDSSLPSCRRGRAPPRDARPRVIGAIDSQITRARPIHCLGWQGPDLVEVRNQRCRDRPPSRSPSARWAPR